MTRLLVILGSLALGIGLAGFWLQDLADGAAPATEPLPLEFVNAVGGAAVDVVLSGTHAFAM